LSVAQLLTQGKDLEREVVAGAEESAETGEEAEEKWNHGTGFYSIGSVSVPALNCLNVLLHGVLTTHRGIKPRNPRDMKRVVRLDEPLEDCPRYWTMDLREVAKGICRKWSTGTWSKERANE
jgi:hypothetical protein